MRKFAYIFYISIVKKTAAMHYLVSGNVQRNCCYKFFHLAGTLGDQLYSNAYCVRTDPQS